MIASPMPPRAYRLPALRRFAIALTTLNVLGHSFLGFEQSLAHPFVGLLGAYSAELVLATLSAWADRRRPLYRGGFARMVEFLLPAHISGLAVAMLLYPGEQVGPVAFASVVAIASKYVVRVPTANGPRHVLNPSNTGISLTLLAFPWVGIVQPYQFTENLSGIGDMLLPLVIVVSGTYLNTKFTGRIPLILGWLGGFALQAVVRGTLAGTPVTAGLMPMTGMTFLLFTFYMVTDPGTTPTAPVAQFGFGAAIAAAYATLMAMHVVFGLFFSLFIVCGLRGVWLGASHAAGSRPCRPAAQPVHVVVADRPDEMVGVAGAVIAANGPGAVAQG